MLTKTIWAILTFLAIAVAGYALANVFVPGFRQSFVVAMFRDDPISAPAHLLGGGLALLFGGLQFSQRLRQKYTTLHRWSGRVYVLGVAIGGSAAFHMALTTDGGAAGQFGFAMLAIAWLISTGMALIRILQRDVARHRIWMVRSFALTLAAVSLRIYLPVTQIQGVPFETAYAVIAWMCWVPNLLIAEWLAQPIVARQKIATRPILSNPG
jgi:uncharacterized membrane protein